MKSITIHNIDSMKKRNIYNYLSFLISILIVIVSLYSILNQDIYNPKLNNISLHELQGQDSALLIFGILCFIIQFFYNESRKIMTILWLGLLSYFIYIYAYYSFSIISSIFYILYLIILGLSLFTFIFLLVKINKNTYIQIKDNYPRKTFSVFFIFVVAIMTILEIPDIVKISILQNKSIIPFQVYYILDLSIVFPAMIIIAVLNIKKNASSYLFTGIIIVKIMTMMPGLLLNEIFYWLKTGSFLDIAFIFIALIFTLASAIMLFIYKRSIE